MTVCKSTMNKIFNPQTKRYVSINSKQGRYVLSQYIQRQTGGSMESALATIQKTYDTTKKYGKKSFDVTKKYGKKSFDVAMTVGKVGVRVLGQAYIDFFKYVQVYRLPTSQLEKVKSEGPFRDLNDKKSIRDHFHALKKTDKFMIVLTDKESGKKENVMIQKIKNKREYNVSLKYYYDCAKELLKRKKNTKSPSPKKKSQSPKKKQTKINDFFTKKKVKSPPKFPDLNTILPH